MTLTKFVLNFMVVIKVLYFGLGCYSSLYNTSKVPDNTASELPIGVYLSDDFVDLIKFWQFFLG